MVIYGGFSKGNIPLDEMADFYRLPTDISEDRPYTWLMFVKSMDGRATFMEKGRAGGHEVALGHFRNDPTLAAKYPTFAEGSHGDARLLQYGWAVADAVMASAKILREEPGQEWNPWEQDIIDYRLKQGMTSLPIHVLVTGRGDLDLHEKVFRPKRGYKTVILTGSVGEEAIRKNADDLESTLGYHPLEGNEVTVHAIDQGTEITHWDSAVRMLRQDYGVRLLDLQGGPNLAGSLVWHKLVDEYRHTEAPHIMGDHYQGKIRPSPIAGVSFNPDNSPLLDPIERSRQVGGHVYHRMKLLYRH